MQDDKLAHLVIFEPGSQDMQEEELESLVLTLMGSYAGLDQTQPNFLSRIQNHSDFLIIKKEDNKQSSYVLEELEEIGPFLNHKALSLKAKLILIHDAHLLNDLVSNKLLKTFEEPPIPCFIFLLNPHTLKLLSTIESRAIKLMLPSTEDRSQDERAKFYLEEMKKQNLANFLEFVQGKLDFKERNFYNYLLQELTNKSDKVEEIESLIKVTKSWESSLEHRLSQAARLTHAYLEAKKIGL